MLQGCLNGDRTREEHPAAPVSAADLARDARSVVAAGAQELHFHPRGPDGLESLEPGDVAQALSAVRAAVPAIPIGLSTRAPIRPGGRARHAFMRAWLARPDHVSVNLIEEDAPEVIAMMLAMGVGVEAGLWSVADARRFVDLPVAARCLRVLIEINEQDVEAGLTVARTILAVLDQAGSRLPRLLHGYEGTAWPLAEEALRRGLDTRIGLEDVLRLPSGERAPDNAALVAAAMTLRAGLSK